MRMSRGIKPLIFGAAFTGSLYYLHRNEWDVKHTGPVRFGRAALVVCLYIIIFVVSRVHYCCCWCPYISSCFLRYIFAECRIQPSLEIITIVCFHQQACKIVADYKRTLGGLDSSSEKYEDVKSKVLLCCTLFLHCTRIAIQSIVSLCYVLKYVFVASQVWLWFKTTSVA